jgi:hypothetical protein
MGVYSKRTGNAGSISRYCREGDFAWTVWAAQQAGQEISVEVRREEDGRLAEGEGLSVAVSWT